MQQITNVSIDILKVHPRNQEFYDDIEGELYEKFKKSIQEDGILTPLIVSPDMTIISGHQRYKGACDLDYKLLPVIIREDLDSEDEKLKKLLATNFGRLKNNPVKQGRVYSEYEKLCGVQHGGTRRQNVALTQDDIAKELGIDVRTIQRLKKLQTLSSDLQQLIENGSVKYTTALNVISKLSNDEQEKLIEEIGKNKIKEMTSKQIQQYINEKQELELTNKALEQSYNELSQKYSQEKNNIKTVEIDKTDYSVINKNKELENKLNQISNEKNNLQTRLQLMSEKAEAYAQDSLEYQQMKEDITYLTKQKDDLGRQLMAITDISSLVVEVDHLIKEKLAPIRYSKSLLEAKDNEIVLRNLTEIVEVVEQWSFEMRKYIPNKINYVEVI